jgi:hypothetical protein
MTSRCPRPWTTAAAQDDERLLVRVTVEMLLRTGITEDRIRQGWSG